VSDRRAALAELRIGDPPERWEALGFEVAGARFELGGVMVRLGASGRGITAWALHGIDPLAEIDGLPTRAVTGAPRGHPADHPNGAIGIDHVVVATTDFDRTSAALAQAGIPLRRTRDAGGFRQGFRRLGPAILELVEAVHAPPGPARFWGLVVVVADLDALAARLADRLGDIHPAVQPGRRIATLRDSAGVTTKVAFMDPE
jgi:hypothetical protein